MLSKRLSTAVALAGAVLGGASIVVAVAGQQRGASSPKIVGVWKQSEVTYTGPNARKDPNPQPGLLIVTRQHFSAMEVFGDKPRPELPPANPTDKQRADAFGQFTAQAGTYEIKGDEIIYRRIVAQSPNAMRAGNVNVATFKLEGDTLWLTPKAEGTVPVANPTTRKWTRLE
jgi:hypothetical protein